MLIKTRGHSSNDLLGEGITTTTRRADCAVDHHVADHLRRCAWTGTTRAKRGFDQACEPDLKLVGRHRLGAGQNTPPVKNDARGYAMRPPGDQAEAELVDQTHTDAFSYRGCCNEKSKWRLYREVRQMRQMRQSSFIQKRVPSLPPRGPRVHPSVVRIAAIRR